MAVDREEIPLVSNVACPYKPQQRLGLYVATVHMTGQAGGLLAPDHVHLGYEIPADPDPLQLVHWVYRRLVQKRAYEKNIVVGEQQIVGLAIKRLCRLKEHPAGPATPLLDERAELYRSMLMSKHGGERIAVKAPLPRDISKREVATLQRQGGGPDIQNAIILPQAYDAPDGHPIKEAVQLQAPRGSRIFGGVNDLVEVIDFDAMWEGHPPLELPPQSTMVWTPVERGHRPPRRPLPPPELPDKPPF